MKRQNKKIRTTTEIIRIYFNNILKNLNAFIYYICKFLKNPRSNRAEDTHTDHRVRPIEIHDVLPDLHLRSDPVRPYPEHRPSSGPFTESSFLKGHGEQRLAVPQTVSRRELFGTMTSVLIPSFGGHPSPFHLKNLAAVRRFC